MHLVLIETSGNQNYIFATNKLRENVGASELTYRAGTQWVLEAVQAETQKKLWSENAATLRENLCRPDLNQPIDPGDNTAVEVITATSGKALLLVNEREVGRRIIRAVTSRALKEAPGLDVCGVISNPFDWNGKSLGEVNREVHEKFEEVRAHRPGPALRFLRLPVIDECQTSGLPAARADRDEGDINKKVPRSELSLKKRDQEIADAYRQRMQSLLDRKEIKKQFPRNPGDLEKRCDRLAVVHADGNGLGEIFLKFADHIDFEKDTASKEVLNSRYVKRLRAFSLALDVCTENAFIAALAEIAEREFHQDEGKVLPLLPIILGGDDLTVMCDGKDALRFTNKFLTAFEVETARIDHEIFGDIISKVAGNAFTPKRLSACAGVAIVKPHFPFSAAYDLAEGLITSAKRVKKLVTDPNKKDDKHPEIKTPWPCSSIDFHALYDSSSSELSEIRRKLRVDDDATKLYARPYVVTCESLLQEGATAANGREWALQHHWSKLQSCVEAILINDDEGRRALPNSQLHDLRAALFLGRETTKARYALIRERYIDKGIKKLEADDGKLFAEDLKPDDDDKSRHITYLLDAMDAANFWRE